MREAAITAQFCHDNVIGLVGVVTRGDPCLMVLQLCDRGALDSLVKGEDVPVPQLTLYARDVAVGMEFLAGRSFVHRDLAARNVLVDARDVAKVADFGMSRDLQDSQYYSAAGGRALPLRWIAPEIFSEARFGESSDVWSFAVTVIETFSKAETPYFGWGNLFVAEKVMAGYRLPRPPSCPEIVYAECVHPCFALEPRDRPRFREIAASLQHIIERGVNDGATAGHAVPAAAPDVAAHVSSPGDCYAMSCMLSAESDPGANADSCGADDETTTRELARATPDPVDAESTATALATPEKAPPRCRNTADAQYYESPVAETQLYESSVKPGPTKFAAAGGNPDAELTPVPQQPLGNLYELPGVRGRYTGSSPLSAQMLAELATISDRTEGAPVPPARAPRGTTAIVDGVELTQDEADALETKSEDSAHDFLAARRATQTGPKPLAAGPGHPLAPPHPGDEVAQAPSPDPLAMRGDPSVPMPEAARGVAPSLSPRLPKKTAVPAKQPPKNGQKKNRVGPTLQ